MTLDKLITFLLVALNSVQVKIILGGIAADVLVNIGVSLYTGTFRLPYVANFIKSKLLPYIFGYAAAEMLALVDPKTYGALPTVLFAIVVGSLMGDVLDGFKQLGVSIPISLTKQGWIWAGTSGEPPRAGS